MGSRATLLTTRAGIPDLEAFADVRGVEVCHVAPGALAGAIAKALDRGAVVVIVSSEPDTIPDAGSGPTIPDAGSSPAMQALALGADEVVDEAEVTIASLGVAVDRATARSRARQARSFDDDGAAAFALLSASVGHDLLAPMMAVTSAHEILANGLRNALEVTDALASWAALVAPTEELRRLVTLRAGAPASADLRAMLEEARETIRRSDALARTLRDIASEGAVDADLTTLLEQIGDLTRPYLAAWAELRVETAGACVASVSRPGFACLVAALLSNAVDSITIAPDSPRPGPRLARRGHIALRLWDHEGVVALEVEDDGRRGPADGPSRGLSNAGARVRRMGGELHVHADASGERIRVLLPKTLGAAPVARASAPPSTDASEGRITVVPRSS